jgi:hypothetical protein
LTVSARGKVSMLDVAKFYSKLPGWDPPSGFTGNSGTQGFMINKGFEKLDVQLYNSIGNNNEIMTHVTLVYTKP